MPQGLLLPRNPRHPPGAAHAATLPLLWTGDPQRPIVLVDYDDVRHSRLYRRVYYATRQVLFLRDQLVILLKLKT